MSVQAGNVLVDRYELEKLVASGKMSSVFEARDRQLSRQVIVKTLSPALIDDAEFVRRFKHEALAAAGLNHANIVKVYDRGIDGKTYFITMEFIDGRSVADLLNEKSQLSPKSACEIIIKVADALEFAHKNGVIHRDIKPDNILIARDGEIKVVDFGIAHIEASSNSGKSDLLLGTVSYFSPEQLQGSQATSASDLYALGIVLYETLAGRPPFRGSSPTAIAHKHLTEAPPPLPENTPPDLAGIVMKLLEKKPENRLQSCGELKECLKTYMKNS